MCACMSQRPGIRNLPRPSATRASGGGGTAVCVTLRMVSPATTTVLFGTIRPSTTSTTLTAVIASTCGCVETETVAINIAVTTAKQVSALQRDGGFLIGCSYRGCVTARIDVRGARLAA